MCWPRGGRSENRVSLAPLCLGTLPGGSLNPGGSVNAHSVQAPVLQRLAADEQPRRRSVPPSSSVLVSQSVNQRWRERPRCPVLRVTPGRRDGVVHAIVGSAACDRLPAHVEHDKRAARAARFRVEVRRNNAACKRNSNQFVRVALVPGTMSRLQIQIQASHHRADHAGAVLGVVNALRFASTRPAAGPSGIDDAGARHDLGYCAMAGFLMTRGREKRVDAGFPQAYLDVSRLCPTAHPPHRTSACRARFQSSPSGHDSSAHPTTSRQAATPSRCA